MARKSSKADPADPKPTAKSKRSKAVVDEEEILPPAGFRPAIVDALGRRRGKALVVIGVVGLLAWGAQAVWRSAAPIVAARERYLIPADRIVMTQPPAWIVADVRGQVIHTAGLDRRLSLLDPAFPETVKNAFALHPWIASVDRIEKLVPAGVQVDVTYRQPVAVIETPFAETRLLLPVDNRGVHLPSEDVPLIRRQYLPRITGIVGQPPVGQRWEDPRVGGAVEIAALLGDVWEALHLQEITPSTRPEVSGAQQYFVYELIARGGTRIQWGPAPQARVPGDDAFAVKLQRLHECVKQYGPLDSIDSPGSVNVRGGLQVGPRMVKKPAARMVSKPEGEVVK
ncbi:MAG: hypothetical protein JNL18_12630 [Planctomycetaceae bacterium]|nr:hypothetical protein [Planctomycetaceae bacterium]